MTRKANANGVIMHIQGLIDLSMHISKAENGYTMKSFFDNGINVSFHTDYPLH